jgi:hypothetical protein
MGGNLNPGSLLYTKAHGFVALVEIACSMHVGWALLCHIDVGWALLPVLHAHVGQEWPTYDLSNRPASDRNDNRRESSNATGLRFGSHA